MNAEPQPNAAAILDTLNEIKRELAENRIDRSSSSILVRPIKIVGESSEPAPAAMPRFDALHPVEPAPPPPRRRSRARRVALGIVIGCAYVGIFAAAGVFVSHAVRPHADGAASVTATVERAAAALAARAHAIVAAWRGSDAVAPAAKAPLAVSVASPPAPAADSHAPRADVNASAKIPPAALPLPREKSAPPAAPVVAASAPEAAALNDSTVPHAQAPPTPTPPAVESPRMAAIGPPAPSGVAASPAPVAAIATPAQDLRLRGDQRLGDGDIASARLFYQRAAEAGDARAALQLGCTYDPAFLTHLGVQGMRGDVEQAASWYRRASALGDGAAEQRLQALPAQ